MKAIFTPYIYIAFFFLKIFGSYAQEFQLIALPKKEINNEVLNNINYKKNHISKKSVYHEIDTIVIVLEKKGYLNAAIDTIYIKDSVFTAQYVLGEQTKKLKIFYKNLPDDFLPQKELQRISLIVTDSYFEIPFSEISNTLQYIVDTFEKNGNSFVQVSLKNIHLENNTAVAELQILDTKTRNIDKIVIKGYENFPKTFISHDLNLKIGSTFNKEKLKYSSQAINRLSFVEEQKPPQVLFTKDSTYIYLYLKKKRSNKFDGIIGFASKEEEESGLEFNGYLDLSFNNIFNTGENIALFWKNNGNDSQRFYIAAETPYIFNLPIIPKVTFELFRQDSTYSNIVTDIDIAYTLNTKGNISAMFHTENSNNLLKTPNENIQSFKNIFYGASYNYEHLINDDLFPVKFRFELSALFGNRKIEKTRTEQFKLLLRSHYLWTINNKNNIFLQNQSALLNSENYVENELFRIGGVNNIRGVNEESIFASTYSIFNIEYRFRPTLSSYFYTITDFSYVENKILDEKINIYSLGLGYAFLTKIGLLNISYAIGKFGDNPFVFNNSKLHIKVINYF